jgi:hypothetical protein
MLQQICRKEMIGRRIWWHYDIISMEDASQCYNNLPGSLATSCSAHSSCCRDSKVWHTVQYCAQRHICRSSCHAYHCTPSHKARFHAGARCSQHLRHLRSCSSTPQCRQREGCQSCRKAVQDTQHCTASQAEVSAHSISQKAAPQ